MNKVLESKEVQLDRKTRRIQEALKQGLNPSSTKKGPGRIHVDGYSKYKDKYDKT